jgi:hypothetical protein
MVSYFKTQWLKIFLAVVNWVVSFVIAFSSPASPDTIEGLYTLLVYVTAGGLWFLAGCVWMLQSYISHNSDCIQKLNDRVTKLENQAITDIEEVEPKHYVCFRKLGPDKRT